MIGFILLAFIRFLLYAVSVNDKANNDEKASASKDDRGPNQEINSEATSNSVEYFAFG